MTAGTLPLKIADTVEELDALLAACLPDAQMLSAVSSEFEQTEERVQKSPEWVLYQNLKKVLPTL